MTNLFENKQSTKDIISEAGWVAVGTATNYFTGRDQVNWTMVLEIVPGKILVNGLTFSNSGIIPTVSEAKEFLAEEKICRF